MRRLLLTLFLGLLMTASALAVATPDVEEIEEISDVEEVIPSAPPVPQDFWRIVGRLHPALVHLPIAWLVLLLLVDLGAWKIGKPAWESFGYLLLVVTVVSFVPAMIAGFLRAAELNLQGGELDVLGTHRNLILLTFGLSVAALGLRAQRRNRLSGVFRLIYLSLVSLAALIVMLAGHFGGKLVHGPAYLPF